MSSLKLPSTRHVRAISDISAIKNSLENRIDIPKIGKSNNYILTNNRNSFKSPNQSKIQSKVTSVNTSLFKDNETFL